MDKCLNAPDVRELYQYGFSVRACLRQTQRSIVYIVDCIADNCLAIPIGEQVFVKQFRFGHQDGWEPYGRMEREAHFYDILDHPGIPIYYGSLHTDHALYTMRQYIQAVPLTARPPLDLPQIVHVFGSLLDIVAYLQRLVPPIYHRNITPDSVLINNQGQVYLVDFAQAIYKGEPHQDEQAIGLYGFIPPEYWQGHPPTSSYDLYGIGMTALCTLAGIDAHQQIDACFDSAHHLNINAIRPALEPYGTPLIRWLERMTHPELNRRFVNAEAAHYALHTLDLAPVPVVSVNPPNLRLTANKNGDDVTQTLIVTNWEPNTLLSGVWDVIPDQPAWFSLSHPTFCANVLYLDITLHTAPLHPGQHAIYHLRLRSNALPPELTLPLQIYTGNAPEPLPSPSRLQQRYNSLFLALVFLPTLVGLTTYFVRNPFLIQAFALLFILILNTCIAMQIHRSFIPQSKNYIYSIPHVVTTLIVTLIMLTNLGSPYLSWAYLVIPVLFSFFGNFSIACIYALRHHPKNPRICNFDHTDGIAQTIVAIAIVLTWLYYFMPTFLAVIVILLTVPMAINAYRLQHLDTDSWLGRLCQPWLRWLIPKSKVYIPHAHRSEQSPLELHDNPSFPL